MTSDENEKPVFNKETIKETLAALKAKDVKDYQNLKDAVYIRWWESVISLILFITMFGFAATALNVIKDETIHNRTMTIWLIVLGIAIIWVIEFLLFKVYSMRKFILIQMRLINELKTEIKEIKDKMNK